MSNARHATGLDAIAAQAQQMAAPAANQMSSLYGNLQGLPAPIRAQKLPMGLLVEVVPNPNPDGPPKLICVTKVQGTHVDFTLYEPDEWRAFRDQVDGVLPLAETSLEVASPSQVPVALRGGG